MVRPKIIFDKYKASLQCTSKIQKMLQNWKARKLFKCLEDHKYVYKFRIVCESTIVQDILWAYLDSVKLFNIYYFVDRIHI